VAHHQFALASGRNIGVSVLGDPLSSRLVVICLPSAAAGAFDPNPEVTGTCPARIIQIDRPGYGSSDPLPDDENPTVEAFADDIAEYLRSVTSQADALTQLEFGRAAVIGWSFGGATALALAARYPELIDRVVLVASPRPRRIRSGERFSAIAELRKHGIERDFRSMKASLDDDGPPSLISLGVDDSDPALEPLGVRGRLERMLDAAWVQESAGLATDRLAVRSRDWLDRGDEVTQKTLLVYGARDVLASAKDAAWFERHIASAHLITVPGAGHLVVIDAWADIVDWVCRGDEATDQGVKDPQLRR
jgi:pimeloyl-ACP methyl ester carboxylesterase